MTDTEILQAMQKMLEPIRSDIGEISSRLEKLEGDTQGIKVLLDVEIRRNIKTIAEGHQVILDRLPDADEMEAMEARLSAVEVVVRKHSKDIQNLKKAQ